jgi:hypothetical protein
MWLKKFFFLIYVKNPLLKEQLSICDTLLKEMYDA